MRSYRGLLLLVLFFNGIIAPLPVEATGDIGFMPDRSIGKEAQDFTLPTARGGQFHFKEAIAGQRSVIVFWTTWCPYCRRELKKINALSEKLKGDNIIPVYINIGESKAKVEKFLADNQYEFDVVLDEKQSLNNAYPIQGIPTLFFVDETGTIKMVEHGLPEDYLRYFPVNG